jgi:hypothetical protein
MRSFPNAPTPPTLLPYGATVKPAFRTQSGRRPCDYVVTIAMLAEDAPPLTRQVRTYASERETGKSAQAQIDAFRAEVVETVDKEQRGIRATLRRTMRPPGGDLAVLLIPGEVASPSGAPGDRVTTG